MTRDPSRALDNAIALLIVTCPCALAMATPLAITVAVGRAARRGIFIKGGEAIEMLAHPSRLLLDKTGTITEARTALTAFAGPIWVKPLVLALERESTHPVAEGFRHAWSGSSRTLPAVERSEHVMGAGIAGRVGGCDVVIGSPAFVAARATGRPPGLRAAPGATPVWIGVDGAVVAAAALGDPIRADARDSIAALRQRGWSVGIVSGDAPEVVRSVARELELPPANCTGGVSPEGKLAIVREALATGPVVMAGDGVNDAAAMAAASVGIGVHGGAEACLATADVYLTTAGLAPLVELTEGAARTMRLIRRNIAFSLAYNTVGVALAVTGTISPLIAAVMMPLSSVTVVFSSWTGRTFGREDA
jgi:Cu2+-exporting ATPase